MTGFLHRNRLVIAWIVLAGAVGYSIYLVSKVATTADDSATSAKHAAHKANRAVASVEQTAKDNRHTLCALGQLITDVLGPEQSHFQHDARVFLTSIRDLGCPANAVSFGGGGRSSGTSPPSTPGSGPPAALPSSPPKPPSPGPSPQPPSHPSPGNPPPEHPPPGHPPPSPPQNPGASVCVTHPGLSVCAGVSLP